MPPKAQEGPLGARPVVRLERPPDRLKLGLPQVQLEEKLVPGHHVRLAGLSAGEIRPGKNQPDKEKTGDPQASRRSRGPSASVISESGRGPDDISTSRRSQPGGGGKAAGLRAGASWAARFGRERRPPRSGIR